VVGAGFGIGRAAPVTSPIAAPVATVVVAGLLLAVIDDQPGLDLEVGLAIGGRTQAALLELLADGISDALFGEVALDPRIIGAVLQGRFLPAPAAIGAEVTGAVEVAV